MSETQHTPVPPTLLPWTVRQSPFPDATPDDCIVESAKLPGKPYKQTILADDYFEELSKRADAEFICRAVNSHSQLVAALEALVKAYRQRVPAIMSSDATWEPVLNAEAALLNARGGK